MNKLLSILVFVFLCTAVLAQVPLKRPERKPKPQKVQSSKPQKTQSSKPKPQPVKKPAVTVNGNNYTIYGVSFEMIPVEGGTFRMGSYDGDSDENPVHNVTLSDYAIGKTEVTQALWKAVMGSKPSYFKGDDNLPVESVSWHDCQYFISKLNQLTGKQFRLPTEAEWEYAARGGNRSKGYKYSGNNDIDAVAWYRGNSGDKTHPVGTKHPNELGIYDMSGNVWEWCQDWYDSSSHTDRLDRGGSWDHNAGRCRTSYRDRSTPALRYYNLGLRLVLSQ